MRIITSLLMLIIVFFGATFAILNASPVSVNYYIGTLTLPLSMLLVMTLGVGFLLAGFIFSFIYMKLKAQIFRLNSKIKVTNKEVENLRSIPLKDYE